MLQIELWILAECDLNPQWRVKIVNIDIKCGDRHIILDPKVVFSFRKSVPECGTIDVTEKWFFNLTIRSNGYVHFGGHAAGYCEISVDISLKINIIIKFILIPILE